MSTLVDIASTRIYCRQIDFYKFGNWANKILLAFEILVFEIFYSDTETSFNKKIFANSFDNDNNAYYYQVGLPGDL